MNASQPDKRVDPLIDAYRQASELEAQTSGARPSAATRAAVLAHARVVAQSATTAEPKLAVSEAVRATPAANESKPVWRMVAGVVLGLAGMWVYQLTRPGTTGEANVAVMTAPQSAKAVATESAVAGAAPAAPASAAAPVTVGATSPAAPATSAATTTAMPAQQETTVAVAALPKPVSTPAPTAAARDKSARERVSETANSAGISGPRDNVADAARNDTSVALAKTDMPAKRAEQAAPLSTPAAPVAVAAAPAPPAVAATSAIPEVATSEPFGETAVASAETRKAARPSAAVRAPVAAAPSVAAAASPNAFPATTTGAVAAAAPPPAAVAASPPSAAAGGSAALRQGIAPAPDAAMLSAVRSGNVNAFRAALARGANVNARDETGRNALQIARERNDAEMVKALELAGAK